MRLYKYSLAICVLLLSCTIIIKSQSDCVNYFSDTNLPTQCSSITLSCTFPSFTNSSLIQNTTVTNLTFIVCLNLPTYSVSFESGSDNLDLSVYVNTNSITLTSYSLVTLQDAIFIATSEINYILSNITAHLIWTQSNLATINNSTLKLEELFQTDCNCLTKGSSCKINPYYFPFLFNNVQQPSTFSIALMNYTYNSWIFFGSNVNSIVVIANNSIKILNSTLRISVIAIYSTSISIISSSINTTGLGFPSGTGYGCGYFNEDLNQLLGCSGTGGSYGGYGGNSSPQGCNLLFSNPPYSRQSMPKYPGSGGGFFLKEVTEVSSGGGVINIQGQAVSIQSSLIIANGVGGIQGGGGGAGGSISLDYIQLSTSGVTSMTVNGGIGKSSGSGGRVRIWNQNWKNINANSQASMAVETLGGLQCDSNMTCGSAGSIVSSPCPPGFSMNQNTYTCQKCPIGTYQLSYSYGTCSTCSNKPSNSYYIGPYSQSSLTNFTQACAFSCNKSQGYTLYDGRQCLGSIDMLLVNIGGQNLLICIGIIVVALIIFLIITMIRKISYSDANAQDKDKHIDYYKKKSHFKIEDIPFHEIRVYFQGENTPQRPWKISQNVKNKIHELYQSNYHKLAIFTRLFTELDEICKYHKGLKIALYALKILYYPLSIVLAEIFRERKSNSIRKAIIALSKGLQSDVGIKFHVNQFYTVGCLQVFNYSKETLDFYIKNYFPMYFKLQKLLIGGYSIDSTDPLLKALYSEFEDKGNKQLQHFFIELNQLLRNEDQSVFKHLWKITQIWPTLQCYLWQPPLSSEQGQTSGILGINNRFTINKNLDLFLLFSIEGKGQNSILSPINQSNFQQMKEHKHSKHFYYSVQLPSIYFDQISCIRQKYNLRQVMIDFEQRKNVFWQIQNTINEKYLSWALASISIISLLLNLFAFFLIVYVLVQYRQKSQIYTLLVYFFLFPLCEFFMIFLQFNLILSKGSKTMSYSIYFSLFVVIKSIIITTFFLVVAISQGLSEVVLLVLFLIWIILFVCNISSLILQCMINSRLAKTK